MSYVYAFWRHRLSGEVFAVQTDETNRLIGICGPLYYREVVAANLPDFEYEPADDPELQAGLDQFLLHEPQEGGEYTSPDPGPGR